MLASVSYSLSAGVQTPFLTGNKLTVQCESGGAGRGSGVVRGHAGVLALILRVNPGDLQLTAVIKLRHPEEV